MPAIESIGAATLLAVDKTGTLTENRMRVAVLDSLIDKVDLRQPDPRFEESTRNILIAANAASERDAFDPMEHAIRDAALRLVGTESQLTLSRQLVREYDLTPEMLAVTHVWQRADQAIADIAVKGAPETVFTLCRIDAEQRRELMQRVTAYAQDGLRVLAVAQGEQHGGTLPDSPREFTLHLLGLLCLADPLRANIPATLAECKQAGIRVVMITGDHAGTALAIAQQAGMDASAGALTGAEVASLAPEELIARTRQTNVYARMAPEQKLLLVRAFKANGEIVVMTGDGVNDAPALKAAHVGVAMGGRGTEVARAAASLVLMNDDFASLVGAVRLGRRIYDNIRNAMSYIIAVHVLIAGMGLLPVLFGWPLLLFPLHVMFLEFVVDPTCSLVFESDTEASDVMRRPPRLPTARLFSRQILIRSALRGAVLLAFNIVVYFLALRTLPETQARALSFMALVMGSILLIFLSRIHRDRSAAGARPSSLFWWVTVLTLAALAIALYVPFIAALFHFQTPPLSAVMLVPLTGLVLGLLMWWARRWLPALN
jgi:Ca2+-transporting ATPase